MKLSEYSKVWRRRIPSVGVETSFEGSAEGEFRLIPAAVADAADAVIEAAKGFGSKKLNAAFAAYDKAVSDDTT